MTTELIPHLEKKYRTDAKPSGRFLTRHSSGGWAALWIQVNHPEFFDGTWPIAPDFRTFAAQTDLTKQPPPNFYLTEDGRTRMTGKIDPEVAAYWDKHYDIANLLRTNWKRLGPLLNAKIHMTVGTADTFHLDESARLLEQTIKDLGGKAIFTHPEERNHFDL